MVVRHMRNVLLNEWKKDSKRNKRNCVFQENNDLSYSEQIQNLIQFLNLRKYILTKRMLLKWKLPF